MALAIARYRHRKGERAHYEPENKRLEWGLTIFTTIGVAAMLTPEPVRLGQYSPRCRRTPPSSK